jgi:hypothetical protein
MSTRPPVKDWATDFDHTDPRWNNDPFPIWDELRRRCPIAHTERFEGGAYFPSRYQDVRDIAYDAEHFSSRRVVVRDEKIDPPIPSPPITSDPPEHRADRMPLLPPFNPKAVEKLQPGTKALCQRLIDRFVGAGRCDAATEYAQHIPTRVIAHMLGVPEDDGDLFRRWIKMALEEGIYDSSRFLEAIREMTAYFKAQFARRGGDGEDLLGYVMGLTHEGRPVPEERRLGMLRLILIAGIDTTWSAIGASLWHLATHDDDRRRLVADPSLMDTAVEELLRAYAPVTMAREVVKDVTINGCPMKPGSMVLLSFPAANRDPEMFPDADRVVIDRKENRHAAFGLGMHRCIGSNLARMELRTALETWLARIPDFRLAEGEAVRWSEGTVRGPRALPVVFGR